MAKVMLTWSTCQLGYPVDIRKLGEFLGFERPCLLFCSSQKGCEGVWQIDSATVSEFQEFVLWVSLKPGMMF
jgi:hypothetical protein